MAADLTQVIQVLRREHLFIGLETDQIARVARFFDQVDIEKGRTIFRQGEEADYFYLVLEGNVRLTRVIKGKTQVDSLIGPGDYLGEISLLFHQPRSDTAVSENQVTLLRLSPNRFHLLMKEYPPLRMNLSATAESRKLVQRLHFDWLGPDELIYYVTRKHILFCILRLFLPLVLLGIGIALAYFLLSGEISLLDILLPLAVMIAAISWVVWTWIDWSNDYYIVTSQRVVRQEKILVFSDSRKEAPLDTVLAVNITSDQLGRLLDYGNVDIRTFTGGVMMSQMSQPRRFASFVEGYRKRIMAISKEKEKERIEEELERALHPGQADGSRSHPTIRIPVAPDPNAAPVKRRSYLGQILATFLKVRYEEGNVITYRKHWFVLMRKTWISLLSIFGFTLVLIVLVQNEIFLTALPCLAGITYAILFFWLGYQYLDWNNDIYRLTPESILDIEKKPLGREQKKTAGLDALDFRVEHTRESLLNIMLNFGTVMISIGQTEFIFHGVHNPEQVHQDVADYREALMRRKLQEKDARDRERMLDWLLTYHKKSGRNEDQEKLPGINDFSG